MENLLKTILGRTEVYLDMHSVIDGFRNVCTVSFIENNSDFNTYSGTNIPSFKEQLKTVKEYIDSKKGFSLFPGWSKGVQFLAKNEKAKEIVDFLYKYPKPLFSRVGEKSLGRLLEYPACCINDHLKSGEIKILPRKIIPFSNCSISCSLPWEREYQRLATKYEVNLNEKYFLSKKSQLK